MRILVFLLKHCGTVSDLFHCEAFLLLLAPVFFFFHYSKLQETFLCCGEGWSFLLETLKSPYRGICFPTWSSHLKPPWSDINIPHCLSNSNHFWWDFSFSQLILLDHSHSASLSTFLKCSASTTFTDKTVLQSTGYYRAVIEQEL